jgi:D-psicose/D-tagatose/L-ribulose 3-epimerase
LGIRPTADKKPVLTKRLHKKEDSAMNKFGLHICYLRGTNYEFDIEKTIPFVKSFGVDILELSTVTIVDFSKKQRLRIKNCATENEIILTANGGFSLETDISSDDTSIRNKGVEYGKRVLEAVYDIGADLFCGINYTAWLRHPDELLTKESKKRIWDLSVESMRKIIKTAEDYNILYCFEIVNRYEEFLLNTAEEGVLYAQQVDSPMAKILLDTFHMNIEEDNMEQAIQYAQAQRKLGHLHVGESNRRIPGLGPSNIDWDAFFKTLKDIQYKGYIVMEPFVRMGLQTSMFTCVWRNLTKNKSLDDFMQDVSRGIGFLSSRLSQ